MNNIIQFNKSVYHIHESNGVYCTLVIGSKKALLIDSGFGCSNLFEIVSTLTDKPIILVNTHGHFDHIQSNNSFSSVLIHKDDVKLLKENSNLLHKLAFYFFYLSKASKTSKAFKAEKKQYLKTISMKKSTITYIKDGDTIDLGETLIKVVETPGHTKGSLCFLDESNHYIYSGDTISNHVWICLKESLSLQIYIRSLERLLSLIDDSYKIISSHSDIPLNTIVITKMIHCCKNINTDKSTVYNHPSCKKSFLYCEGLEQIKDKYNISTFEEMSNNIDTINKDVFINGEFVSIVYRMDKLR